VDIVFGVSMAPSTVRMVLVEGENGDGATVDQDAFPVTTAAATGNAATSSATDQVLAAILGTRQGAAESGYRLASTGVTWVDPVEAGVLRDALAAHRVENIMLVSAFLSAAALAQAYGTTIGYAHTGLLFIEPDCATLAVVDSRTVRLPMCAERLCRMTTRMPWLSSPRWPPTRAGCNHVHRACSWWAPAVLTSG
jgi:hypothetical protein